VRSTCLRSHGPAMHRGLSERDENPFKGFHQRRTALLDRFAFSHPQTRRETQASLTAKSWCALDRPLGGPHQPLAGATTPGAGQVAFFSVEPEIATGTFGLQPQASSEIDRRGIGSCQTKTRRSENQSGAYPRRCWVDRLADRCVRSAGAARSPPHPARISHTAQVDPVGKKGHRLETTGDRYEMDLPYLKPRASGLNPTRRNKKRS
jgi:hypothetical protein